MNLGGDDKFYHILLELLMYPAATSNGRGGGAVAGGIKY